MHRSGGARRAFRTVASRRGLLAILGGGLLLPQWPGLGIDETDARRNGKRHRRRKRQRRGKKRRGGKTPPAVTAAPVTRTDAACSPGAGVLALAGDKNRLAQTFTAFASGPLVRADLDIARPVGAGGDFVLRLSPVQRIGEVLVPTNDVLAESVVAAANVPIGGALVPFVFATPFPVVAGTAYALVLSRPEGGGFAWVASDANLCPSGSFLSPNQTGSFIDTSGDFFFTAFVVS